MNKKQLRHEMLACLKNLSKEEREQWSRAACQELSQLSAYQEAKTLATYLSLPHELDTSFLIEQAQKDGKRVLIPKTYSGGRMVFVTYQATNLFQTKFGIWEPVSDLAVAKKEIDLIHVPGLAWNGAGYRIGYGGGFYDRYLADYSGFTVSTIQDFQRVEFQEEPFDQAVRKVIQYAKTDG